MTTQLTAKHISRLIDLRDQLTHFGPARFDMGAWFIDTDTTETFDSMNWDELMHRIGHASETMTRGECGTAACLAGHAALMWADELNLNTTTNEIAELLGMDVGLELGVRDPALERWFAVSAWPDWARISYRNASRAIPYVDYTEDDYAEQVMARDMALRAAQWTHIMSMLDDLITGRRLHWHDEDTSAADIADRQDAQ